MQNPNRGWVVLILFFCSGATALVYEVIWSKFLAQMFGSTIYAQTIVLAVFMAGLALGNNLFGRYAHKWSKPVSVYGYLEIGIGIFAFLFPSLDHLADFLFVSLGSHVADNTVVLLALKAVLSASLLLLPTILMGGTLPLLAAWLQRSSLDAGRRSARFYSVNSFGAVLGSLLAGFWLVQDLGMIASLQMTALVNVIIGGLAVLLSQKESRENAGTELPSHSAQTEESRAGVYRWAGVMVAVTGFVAMGLEVLASRSLALIFGSSLQSFALVLVSFILGIGLGSAWIASKRRHTGRSEALIVTLLCAAALWVILLVFNIEHWVDCYRIVGTGIARTATGYVFHQFLTAVMAMVILGIPAACIGAVLPLMVRVVSQRGVRLGERVGALLTWNTLGAVAGALCTGFLLMPLVGLRNAFGVLALSLALVAFVTAMRSHLRIGLAGAGASCVLAICLFLFGGESWRHVISSGAFRSRETVFDPTTMEKRKQHMVILFYEDAADATVSVERGDGIGAPRHIGLRINGKPDASNGTDLGTQLLVAHLPMLARGGHAEDIFILGFGSGISAGALLAYPVKQVVIAENCGPVIEAGHLFRQWNRDVLNSPITKIYQEDARTVLKLNSQKYDVIITQPSNPWTAGIGSVFSKEYYELAASRLKPGGIVAQWFHVYEMHDGIVDLVLRTFSSVYPYVEVWDTDVGDIVMLGALQPWKTGPEVFKEGFVLEGVRSDLALIGIPSPEALLAKQLASQRTGFAIAGNGAIQTDMFPVLEYAAPRAFYIGNGAHRLEQFDERTRQIWFAPPEKRNTLRELSADDVQSVFSRFKSQNRELMAHISGASSTAQIPCLLRSKSDPAAEQGGLGGTQTERPLDGRLVAALGNGDFVSARQIAQEILEQEPTNDQAAYVARVLSGQRVFSGSILETARR